MASLEHALQLEDVSKTFYTNEIETHALSGIHPEIRQGERVSIAGPSGRGESTLLSILGTLDSPSEGSYLLNGKWVNELSHSGRARVRNSDSSRDMESVFPGIRKSIPDFRKDDSPSGSSQSLSLFASNWSATHLARSLSMPGLACKLPLH